MFACLFVWLVFFLCMFSICKDIGRYGNPADAQWCQQWHIKALLAFKRSFFSFQNVSKICLIPSCPWLGPQVRSCSMVTEAMFWLEDHLRQEDMRWVSNMRCKLKEHSLKRNGKF